MSYFLDTTIQYIRVVGHSHDQKGINSRLDTKPIFCSKYVLMEFKRGFIKGFIKFYSIVEEEKTLEDAFARFSRIYSGREKSIILAVTGKLLKCFDSKERILHELKRYIDWQLIDTFEEGIEYTQDKINCRLADADTSLGFKEFVQQLHCRKGDVQCRVDHFMKINKKRLLRIHECGKDCTGNKDTEIQSLALLAKRICGDYQEARGRNCKRLGDTIIALECPKEATLSTTDRIYEFLGEAMGKQVEIFKHLSPL